MWGEHSNSDTYRFQLSPNYARFGTYRKLEYCIVHAYMQVFKI